MFETVSDLPSNPRQALAVLAPWLLIAAAAAILGSAFAFEYFGGLRPCALCLQQRWPHAIAVGLGLILVAGRPPLWASALVLLVASLVLYVGSGLAFYHVGVEQHWWEGSPACGGGGLAGQSAADLRAQLLATPMVRCDEIVWSLLGLSMAGWNFVLSAILGSAMALAGMDRLRQAWANRTAEW